MSLINDALKKAQTLQARNPAAAPTFPRANTPATAASNPAAPSPAPASTPAQKTDPLAGLDSSPTPAMPLRKGKSSQTALLVGIVVSVLLVGMGALGYVVYAIFFTLSPEDEIAQAAKPAPAAVQPANPAPSPTNSVAPTTNTGPSASAPVASPAGPIPSAAPAPAPAKAPITITPAPVETRPAVAATPPPPAVVTPRAPTPAPVPEPVPVEEHVNNPSPVIQAWVNKIVVAGIRAGDRPKALMNDRVYLIGDTVSPEHGLKLFKISDRELVFKDADGNTYEYRF